MPITKATQNVITPNIVTTDTNQTISKEKTFQTSNYVGSSTTSLSFTTGSKTLTTNTGLAFISGDGIKISRTYPFNYAFMTGTVTSYNSSTGQLTANITFENSSGSWTSWEINNNSTTPALTLTQNGNAPTVKIGNTTNTNSIETIVTNQGKILVGATSMPTIGNYQADNDIYVNGLFCQRFQPFAPATTGMIFGNGSLNPRLGSLFGGSQMTGSQFEWRNSPYTFMSSGDAPLDTDLLAILDQPYPSVNKIISNPDNSVLLEVKVLVKTIQSNLTTGKRIFQRGAYSGSVVIGVYGSSGFDGVTPDFIGYTANSLSTTQPGTGTSTQVNFTTAAGIAPTLGGAPATGFASIIAVRETTSNNGSLTLQIRPHTTANTATIEYYSTTSVHILMSVL
jgi:hypothetical protein